MTGKVTLIGAGPAGGDGKSFGVTRFICREVRAWEGAADNCGAFSS